MNNPPSPKWLDHRELNHDLAVFATDPSVGSGLPMWLPAGAVIRQELERLAAEIARDDGCMGVYSPVLAKRSLYEVSGHWTKFSDDMFPAMPDGGDELVLRPANCPHHALMYGVQQRSYRELPVRFNELATMFRAERSGVLSGLSRVRQISLDDTHVFCRRDQITEEVERALRSALKAQQILGLPVDYVRLSLRDDGDGYLGSVDQWKEAGEALRLAGENVLSDGEVQLIEVEGEAAFYGPKLDLQVRSEQGKEDTIATIQLDFNQPENFDLTYIGADGRAERVAMIHRGTVGSMERVAATLLEHYQGRLPLWLAPAQLCVMPVGPEQDEAARALVDEALGRGLRAIVKTEGSVGARIRASRQRRDSVMAVLGDRELAQESVEVTDVASGFKGSVARGLVLDTLVEANGARSLRLAW